MNDNCRECLERTPLGTEECSGLSESILVNSGIEKYLVQVCRRPSLANSPPRFYELQHNGPGIIVVHGDEDLTKDQAVEISKNFDL